jgi:hypothetical protein
MPVQTLPEGYIWLGDAFRLAWSKIEDAAKHDAALGRREPGEYGPTDEAWQQYDDSLRRVEKQMRTALAFGGLHAWVRDAQTGQPGKLHRASEWIDKPSFGVPGLLTELHHNACPGPDTEGRPVFVLESELHRFIHAHTPVTSDLANASLIARTAWAAPVEADAAALAQLPGGDWIKLSAAINFLAFGQASGPEQPDLTSKALQLRAFRAMLERARVGKCKMAGTCSMGGPPGLVEPFTFTHALVPTDHLDGFNIDPDGGGADAYELWRTEKPNGLLWHNVTVERASLKMWLADLSSAAPKAKPPGSKRPTTADINAYLDSTGGDWGSTHKAWDWFKENRPNCTKQGVTDAYNDANPDRKQGRKKKISASA